MGMTLSGCTTTTKQAPPPAPATDTKKPQPTKKSKKERIPYGFKRYKDKVLLYAEFDANRRTPLSVDLVFIYNPKRVRQLSQLNARQWFNQRQQLLQQYAGDVSVVSSEVLPGDKKHLPRFTKKQKRAKQIMVFSSYQSVGAHKVIIKPKDINYIYMMKNHFIAQ